MEDLPEDPFLEARKVKPDPVIEEIKKEHPQVDHNKILQEYEQYLKENVDILQYSVDSNALPSFKQV